MTSKYHRTIKGTSIDVYDVLTSFGVTNPATAHAVKKLLMPRQRGAKNTLQDLAEAKASVERAIQIEGEALGRQVDPVRAQGHDVPIAIVGSQHRSALEKRDRVNAGEGWEVPTATVPSAEGDC